MDKIPWVKQHRPRSNCQRAALHKSLFFIRPLSCSPIPPGCIQRIGQMFESLLSSCDICLFAERHSRETSAVLEFSWADTGPIFRTMRENRWRKQTKIGTHAIIWSRLCLNCCWCHLEIQGHGHLPQSGMVEMFWLDSGGHSTGSSPLKNKIKWRLQNVFVLGPSSWQLLLGQRERETGRWLHYINVSLV